MNEFKDMPRSEQLDAYDISQVAAMLDIPASALRFYDRKGLVRPQRTEAGYRMYSIAHITELTDIIQLREAGMSIKAIETYLESPIEDAMAIVDEAERAVIDQLSLINRTLGMLVHKTRSMRTYLLGISKGPHLVAKPGIEKLWSFDMGNPVCLKAHVTRPEDTGYSAFFPCARDASNYIDCSRKPIDGYESAVVWKRAGAGTEYVECILETEYSYSDRNNLPELVDWMTSRGLEPGHAIAEYLTFESDTATGARKDYYRAWIEVLGHEAPTRAAP